MARIEASVLGNLSGKLGQLVARVRKGETILAASPSGYTVPQTPEAIARRQKFKVTIQLAKVINEISDLYKIWNKVKSPKLSVINMIVKKNYQYSDSQNPTADNILTPGGFQISVTSSAVAADSITIELPALNTQATFSADEKTLSATIFLVMFDPTDNSQDYFKILKFNHTEANYDPTQTLEIVSNLDQFQQNELAGYGQKLVLLSLATKDADDKIVQYSTTYGKVS